MLEGSCCEYLREVMERSFPDYYDYYESICKSCLSSHGQTMQDPFGERRGIFVYGDILKRLVVIKKRLEEKADKLSDDNLSDSESKTQNSTNS
ncbi:hypothetical protein ScPMuIL_012624 [Solemya velum]